MTTGNILRRARHALTSPPQHQQLLASMATRNRESYAQNPDPVCYYKYRKHKESKVLNLKLKIDEISESLNKEKSRFHHHHHHLHLSSSIFIYLHPSSSTSHYEVRTFKLNDWLIEPEKNRWLVLLENNLIYQRRTIVSYFPSPSKIWHLRGSKLYCPCIRQHVQG